jgi:hypothetical protein
MIRLHNAKIDFSGFEPTHEIKAKIQLAVEQVTWMSPSDSLIRVLIEKVGATQFQVKSRVVSVAKIFSGQSYGQSALEALNSCLKTVHGDIYDWKRQRA